MSIFVRDKMLEQNISIGRSHLLKILTILDLCPSQQKEDHFFVDKNIYSVDGSGWRTRKRMFGKSKNLIYPPCVERMHSLLSTHLLPTKSTNYLVFMSIETVEILDFGNFYSVWKNSTHSWFDFALHTRQPRTRCRPKNFSVSSLNSKNDSK